MNSLQNSCYIEYNNYISIDIYRQRYRDIDLDIQIYIYRWIEIEIYRDTIDKAYIRANKWDRGDAYDFTFKYLLLKASVVVNNHSKLCPIIRNKLKTFFFVFVFVDRMIKAFTQLLILD